MNVQHPGVKVKLVGQDGDSFAIIGRVAAVLRREVGPMAAAQFIEDAAASGSYDDLVQLVMSTVEVE